MDANIVSEVSFPLGVTWKKSIQRSNAPTNMWCSLCATYVSIMYLTWCGLTLLFSLKKNSFYKFFKFCELMRTEIPFICTKHCKILKSMHVCFTAEHVNSVTAVCRKGNEWQGVDGIEHLHTSIVFKYICYQCIVNQWAVSVHGSDGLFMCSEVK